jgi:uncharacterized protein YbaR (Trm112 family)/SAM-dependent methyltransferase
MTRALSAWLDVLGCPYCTSPLEEVDDGALRCTACGRRFPQQDGIPLLLRTEEVEALGSFSHRYREARLSEGWRSLDAAQALALPRGNPPGYPPLYWRVRRQSYRALQRFLAREGPAPEAGPAADLGAGTGWLAHRLAEAGYRALAVEASLDAEFGLCASTVYCSAFPERFLPVQGDLDHPPLRRGALSLVVLNASLHYAHDLLGTLRKAARSLQAGGRLIVMDTPVASHARPGTGRGDRHLGRGELQEALAAAGLEPRCLPVIRGLGWCAYRARAWAHGDAPFSFPLVVGYREEDW